MSRSRFKVLLLTLGVGALTAVTVSGFGQAPPGLAPGGGPRFPGVVPQPQAGRPENAAKKFQPLWGMSQAYVKLEGADTLRVRAELPVHGLVKLLDADNQPVSVHRFQPWQPPPFTVPVKEARVFDTRGREQAREDWLKLFRNEPLVLLATDAGQITPENIADAYRLFREDLLVVVLPGQAITQLDLSKAFPPVKSLPQAFPGQPPVPGGPTPPPPSGR